VIVNEYHVKAVSIRVMKRKNWIKQKGRVFALLLAVSMLSGCSSVENGDENLILIEKEQESLAYEMEAASVADVRKTEKTR